MIMNPQRSELRDQPKSPHLGMRDLVLLELKLNHKRLIYLRKKIDNLLGEELDWDYLSELIREEKKK